MIHVDLESVWVVRSRIRIDEQSFEPLAVPGYNAALEVGLG